MIPRQENPPLARELARRIGYVYIDSGAMYRNRYLYALEHGMASPDTGLNAARTR